jgi:hypothetical protein
MYKVTENKLDMLLSEATNLVDKLSHSSSVTKTEIQHFGNSLLDIQTEVRNQINTTDIGFGSQRLEA